MLGALKEYLGELLEDYKIQERAWYIFWGAERKGFYGEMPETKNHSITYVRVAGREQEEIIL